MSLLSMEDLDRMTATELHRLKMWKCRCPLQMVWVNRPRTKKAWRQVHTNCRPGTPSSSSSRLNAERRRKLLR